MDPIQAIMDVVTFMINGEFGEAEHLLSELKNWHFDGGKLPDRHQVMGGLSVDFVIRSMLSAD